MNDLPQLLFSISYKALPLLFAMVLHEYAHGWVANKCGDPTAKLPGSFLFGWAKPVPVDARNMRQPRRDMALVAAAGPGMNLALALVSALLLAVLLAIDPSLSIDNSSADKTESGA